MSRTDKAVGGPGSKAKKKSKKKKPGNGKLQVNGGDSQNNGLEISPTSDKDEADGNDDDEPPVGRSTSIPTEV
jgi:hypothetical protein